MTDLTYMYMGTSLTDNKRVQIHRVTDHIYLYSAF
jgi:hypothetical protein